MKLTILWQKMLQKGLGFRMQRISIKWRDRKVRLKNIKPGHLVFRRVANTDTVGKLQLKWEGPFLVVSSSRPGSYRLKDMDNNDIPRSWNADELRRYYVQLDVIFYILFHGTLFLSKGGERFLTGPQHVISLFYFSSIRAKSPKDVNVKAEKAPSSAKKKRKGNREKLKSRCQGNAELTAKSQR